MSSKSKNAVDDELRTIYVIQIAPKWVQTVRPELDPEIKLLYVGQSKRPPGKRFKQHRRGYHPKKKGGEAAARVFRTIHSARLDQGLQGTLVKNEDAWLRRDLMNGIPVVEGKAEAEKLELATAESLRGDGYFVVGPKLSRADRKRANRVGSR